jgi:type I site-specific restriction-modification system R (restriction) subunit
MYSRENDQDEYDSTSKKSLITVKKHMKDMEDQITELRRDINENKRVGKIIRSENQALEHKTKEKCNELAKLVGEDLNNFSRDVGRVKQNDYAESDFFGQQIKALVDDKLKLKLTVIQLEKRLRQCETDVGMGFL